jgi:hypothetical protein
VFSDWHERFKESGENMEDDECSGHPRYQRTDGNLKKKNLESGAYR